MFRTIENTVLAGALLLSACNSSTPLALALGIERTAKLLPARGYRMRCSISP